METAGNRRILFVYNASKGWASAMIDTAHKMISPDTYSCSLCRLTHGALLEKKAWQQFREKSRIPMHFLYREEFLASYASRYDGQPDFPIILEERNGRLQLLVTADELRQLDNLEALMALMETKLRAS